jgi:hypothetical protein
MYPDDGSVRGLFPGRTYGWQVTANSCDDCFETDPRVIVTTVQVARGRFTVVPGPSPPPLPGPEPAPVLPDGAVGKIAYNSVLDAWWYNWVRAYDIDAQEWLSTGLANDGLLFFPQWSPDGSKLLYTEAWDALLGPQIRVDLLDGSPPVAVPGVGGHDGRWAADGTRVVYTVLGPWSPTTLHNNDIWVASIDGLTNYPLVDSIDYQERWPAWSPDGLWIVYRKMQYPWQGLTENAWLVRYDGTEDHPLIATDVTGYEGYDVGYWEAHDWSPDGLSVAVNFGADDPDTGQGIGGIGTISREGGPITPVFLAPADAVCCAGPKNPRWSPDAKWLAFSSGHHLPPDPDWAFGKFEPGVELWLAEVDGTVQAPEDLIRVTYNETFDQDASWWAPNTEPGEPGEPVTVVSGDTTVILEGVVDAGTTTAVTFDDPPGPEPGGFQFLGDYYDISTTATLEPGSKITIEIHYDDADVPGGQEEWLSLMHWETDHWEDITVRPINTVDNIITGECYSLSAFGIAFGPQFVGLLPPVNNDGSSVFKLNRTVPAKFQLKNSDGSFMTDALAKLYVGKVSDQVVGSYTEPESTSAADSGNTFRYDADASQYVFNLGTKGLSTGTWALQVAVNGIVMKEVWISLK